jgi:hypothetical protein
MPVISMCAAAPGTDTFVEDSYLDESAQEISRYCARQQGRTSGQFWTGTGSGRPHNGEKMTFLKVNLPLRGSSNQVDTHTGMIAMGIILWSFLR